MKELSDRDLVRRARQGDRESFDELLRRHSERVFNSVFRYAGNHQDAFDITQNVFLNAYRKLDSFKDESAFSTWLYRIAFNESVSFFRSRGRRKAVSIDAESEEGEAAMDPAADGDPREHATKRDASEAVQRALNGLDDESRKIVILRELEGYAYEEIAELLDVPIGTVRSKLHRARIELKDKLASLVKSRAPI